MREDQSDALEKLQRELFPLGLLVLAPMPNDTLHSAVLTPTPFSEHNSLLCHLREKVIAELKRLNSDDQGDEETDDEFLVGG